MAREFQITRDMIDVTAYVEDNPEWHYVCACGGIISWENIPRGRFARWEYFEDGERLPIIHFYCRECDKRIPDKEMAKASRPATTKKFAPGLTRYTIDGRQVTKEEYDRELLKGEEKANGTVR